MIDVAKRRYRTTNQPTPTATQGKARWGAGMSALALMAFEFIGIWSDGRLTIEYVLWYVGEHREVLAVELIGTFSAVYMTIYGATNRVKQRIRQ